MRRLGSLCTVLFLLALALATAAQGKGPAAARIDGPGLAHPIVLKGFGEPGSGSPLGRLVGGTGFFAVTFGQVPDPVLRQRPQGRLGPRYTVAYTVPGPDGDDTIRQDLYPYARPQPLSYTPAGQRFFGDQLTYGGWIRGSADLRAALVSAGLPEREPSPGGASWWPPALGGTAGVLALATLLGLLRRRRRPRLGTAPAGRWG
jgi:hypothetical protein